MKRLALSLFAAVMLMGSGFGVYTYSLTATLRPAAKSTRVVARILPVVPEASIPNVPCCTITPEPQFSNVRRQQSPRLLIPSGTPPANVASEAVVHDAAWARAGGYSVAVVVSGLFTQQF
jgi:hypothetical protein